MAGFDGHFRELSTGWSELLGYSTDELTARWLAWTAIGVPEEQAYRAVARDLTLQHDARQAKADSEQRYAD
ncbi:hypothetical protein ET475_10300 [Microbacterium protaetiae]|uniref:PAS domain S-box protein n=1 Tax=Microbacterium protaetiae TaxID=2509458 RepID=A0A4P6EDJ6_9MICO|nr:hypothetical protein ET475_10300 [Microbacterium protaetiae]